MNHTPMPIPPIHYGIPMPVDYSTLLDQLPDFNMEKVTRSSFALIAYWSSKHEAILSEIASALQISDITSCQVCFEYPVRPSIRYCKASFSDVMLLLPDRRVAIESKRTEQDNETLAKWLKKGDAENRQKVLKYWKEQIKQYSNTDLSGSDYDNVIKYQLLHRTASACFGNPNQADVLYQLFNIKSENSSKRHSKYVEEIQNMVKWINPKDKLRFWVHEIECEPKDAYHCLAAEMKGKRDKNDKANLARDAIRNASRNPLFNFEKIPVRQVG